MEFAKLTKYTYFTQRLQLINFNYWAASCCLEAMTSASPGPAWALEGGHPLRPPLLPHLHLQPHRPLPPPRCISCSWGDETHPCQSAHCLRPHCTSRHEAPILPHNCAKELLWLLPSSCPANVCNPCLSTCLNKWMEILRALAPVAHHIGLQLQTKNLYFSQSSNQHPMFICCRFPGAFVSQHLESFGKYKCVQQWDPRGKMAGHWRSCL